MKSLSSHKPLTRLSSASLFALVLTVTMSSTLYSADDRVSWDNGAAGNSNFTDPGNWSDFDGTTPGGAASDQLPGWRSTGGNSNAIIQGGSTGANTATINSDFSSAFNFNPLIVRGGQALTINAQLNIPNTQFWTAQTNSGNLITHNASGSVIASGLFMGVSGGTGTYNMNGGSITVSGDLDNTRTLGSNFNFGVGGNGENVSLTAGRVLIDNANNNTFTVGSGSSLTITGSGTSSFADGLAVTNGGVLAASGTITANMTVDLGGVLSISPGNSPGTLSQTGDQTWGNGGSYLWEINDSDGDIGADPGPNGWDWLDIDGTLDLSSLSAGGFTIDIDSLTSGNVSGLADGFDSFVEDGFDSPVDRDYLFEIVSATSISGFDASNFTLDSSGFLNSEPDFGWQWAIIQDGNSLFLEAYAVPEPSSTALLGLGLSSLLLRRKRS